MKDNNENHTIHTMIAEDRRRLTLSGVTDAERFDESSVILYTTAGKLVIKGRSLTVSGLDTENGDMTVQGEINSLVYGDRDHGKTGILGRLLR